MSIKVGIAGLGKMGSVYAKEVAGLPGFEVVAVYDPDKARMDISHGTVVKCQSLEEFVQADFDLGIVTSLTGTHHLIAVPLFNTGKYVLSEKPIDENLEQADKIIHAAQSNHKPLMVAFVEYFNPVTEVVTNNLHRVGALQGIEISRKRPELEPTRQVGSNVLLDCLVHDLYNLIEWLPTSIDRISAKSSKKGNTHMPYDDEGSGRLYAGPVIVEFEASWAASKLERLTRLYGESGTILVDYVKLLVAVRDNFGAEEIIHPQQTRSNIQSVLFAVRATMEQGKPFPVDIRRSRYALEVCKKIEESARRHGEILNLSKVCDHHR